MMRSIKDWIRRWLLRKTATPYECYWRDRAFRAERELAAERAHNVYLRESLSGTLHTIDGL